MNKIFWTLISISVLSLSTGCGKKTDADKISEAQACLDAATSTTAADCMTIVDGMETAASHLIRCVARILEANFLSISNIQNIVDSTKNGSSATSTASAFDYLAFPMTAGTLTADYAKAQDAYDKCKKSESPGMMWIMNLAFTASSAKYCVLLGNGATISAALGNAACQSAVSSTIGTALNEAYTSNCGSGQSQQNSAVCSQMDQARAACGSSNSTGIGKYLMDLYSGDTTPTCS